MTRTRSNRKVSLLFDVFVLNQRLRSLLNHALTESGLRPDEYAVYSLLYEMSWLTPTEMATEMAMPVTTVLDYLRAMSKRGHVKRARNPADGRSYRVSLTMQGLAEHRRTNREWNVAVRALEKALGARAGEVREALHALDDAADTALTALMEEQRAAAG